MKSKCTLKDVAKACGVSAYTVSRAINDKKDISKETKEKILKKAKELGYVQNLNAKNLRTGNSNTIAIVYDDFENPYYNTLIKKITTILNEKGYFVTLFYDFDSIGTLNSKLMGRILSSNVDAIISFIYVTPGAKKLNSKWKKPMIQIGAHTNDNDISCFTFNDFHGGRLITKYLLEKGYKKIGFINASKKLIGCLKRIEGYKSVLLEENIGVEENLIIHLTESEMELNVAVEHLLEKNCDGIICFNDITALFAMKYLQENEISGVEVCGFDDIKKSFPITIPFASVQGDVNQLVEEAVNHLLECIILNSENIIIKVFDVKIC